MVRGNGAELKMDRVLPHGRDLPALLWDARDWGFVVMKVFIRVESFVWRLAALMSAPAPGGGAGRWWVRGSVLRWYCSFGRLVWSVRFG